MIINVYYYLTMISIRQIYKNFPDRQYNYYDFSEKSALPVLVQHLISYITIEKLA